MAAPTDNVTPCEDENIELCEIEATVATGFEQTAKEEVEEKFGIAAKAARGKVIAKIPVKDVASVLDLGCVDNVRVVMTSWKDVQFSKDELECMGKLRQLVKDVDWEVGLKVWKQLYTFKHPISSNPVSEDYDLGEPFLFNKDNLPKKQSKDKRGKSGKKDKFGKKGKDKKDKRKEDFKKEETPKETKNDSSDRQSGLQYVSDEGKYVQGCPPFMNPGHGYRHYEEGQFDDAESDTDAIQSKGRESKPEQTKELAANDTSDLTSATGELSLEDTPKQTQNANDAETLDSVMQKAGEKHASGDADTNHKETGSSVDLPTSPQVPSIEASRTPASASCQTQTSESSQIPSKESSQIPSTESTSPQKPEISTTSPEKKEKLVPHNPLVPAFRVTCNRAGEGHHFDSQGAAANFGGAVQQYFGWNVDMKKFDIEVILNIEWTDVAVCIGLTRESLHHRNISVFGATTLRPTIAHNMLRLCKIQPGDIVCDPMCGCGSIPIQGARCWPQAFHIGGDIFLKGVDRTAENVTALNKSLEAEKKSSIVVDTAYWDANYLPFKENSIDVFITDLPFGKRIGSRYNNQRLYPDTLLEMARVCRPGTGRVCVLTQDKKAIVKAIQALGRFWQRRLCLSINLGGLAAGVYLLNRTNNLLNRGPHAEQEVPRNSGCRDFRASMPSDPRSGSGFTVVRHTFNSSAKTEVDSDSKEKSTGAKASDADESCVKEIGTVDSGALGNGIDSAANISETGSSSKEMSGTTENGSGT